METDIIIGKILEAIRSGAKTFKEVEAKTLLSANTITKYTHFLEEEGLLIIKPDKDRRKIIYQLNEAKIRDIDSLIRKYIELEEKEVERKFNLIAKFDLEKAKNLLKKLEENIGKHTSTTLDRHEGFRKFPSSIKDLVEEKK
ncbi:MAG: helix-turn-helix domain-containing protein [Archaeoglobaceae archaeon]